VHLRKHDVSPEVCSSAQVGVGSSWKAPPGKAVDCPSWLASAAAPITVSPHLIALRVAVLQHRNLNCEPHEHITCQHGESELRPARQHQDQIYDPMRKSETATSDLLRTLAETGGCLCTRPIEIHNHTVFGTAWTCGTQDTHLALTQSKTPTSAMPAGKQAGGYLLE